ncbi:MAG: VOC family protein [Micrococcaceae bacterium]
MNLLESVAGRKADQIGILVPDLSRGAQEWGALWGVEKWSAFTFSPETLTRLTFRGEESDLSMRLAISGTGPQIEIIEPTSGPSIYSEWIEEHGYGLHHFGYYVDSLSEVTRELSAAGHEPVQTGEGFGADGTGHFAYYENLAPNGVFLEFIEAARQRREPEEL